MPVLESNIHVILTENTSVPMCVGQVTVEEGIVTLKVKEIMVMMANVNAGQFQELVTELNVALELLVGIILLQFLVAFHLKEKI